MGRFSTLARHGGASGFTRYRGDNEKALSEHDSGSCRLLQRESDGGVKGEGATLVIRGGEDLVAERLRYGGHG